MKNNADVASIFLKMYWKVSRMVLQGNKKSSKQCFLSQKWPICFKISKTSGENYVLGRSAGPVGPPGPTSGPPRSGPDRLESRSGPPYIFGPDRTASLKYMKLENSSDWIVTPPPQTLNSLLSGNGSSSSCALPYDCASSGPGVCGSSWRRDGGWRVSVWPHGGLVWTVRSAGELHAIF